MGQLGRYNGNPPEAEPAAIAQSYFGDEKVVHISTQDDLTFAATEDGKVYFFGNCPRSLCGSTRSQLMQIPTEWQLEFSVKRVFIGSTYVFFETKEGYIYSSGRNNYG